MAEQELQRMTELLSQVNREYEQFGRILPDTQKALLSANAGIKNFDMQLNLAGNALKGVAGALTSYTKEMYNGTQGSKAFNQSVNNMADAVQAVGVALSLLVPGGVVIKGVVAGLAFLAGEAMKAGNVVGEQGDKLYDAYQGLAKTGAAAGDGMTGVFNGLQKMGLGVQQATSYLQLFGENAQTMAQFGGTVSRGRKQFETTIEAMKPFRSEMRALGLSQEEQNEAAMTYVKIQNRLNNSTRDNSNITGAAAAAYIKEMDQLTKVTGMSRKQQEDALEKAMRSQVFGSVVDEMVDQGNTKAAKQLQTVLKFAASQGEDFAAGIEEAAAGNLRGANAQKLYMSSQNTAMELIDKIKSNQIGSNQQLADELQVVAKTMAEVKKDLAASYGAQVGEDYMLSYATMAKVNKTSTNNFAEAFNKAATEINEQTGKNNSKQDELLADSIRIRNAQQETMLAEQKLVDLTLATVVKGQAAAAEAAEKMAKAALYAAQELFKLGRGAGVSQARLAQQDDINWQVMTFTEKLISGLKRLNEKVGSWLSSIVGFFSKDAGEWMQAGVDTNKRTRVQSETSNLMQQGSLQPGSVVLDTTGKDSQSKLLSKLTVMDQSGRNVNDPRRNDLSTDTNTPSMTLGADSGVTSTPSMALGADSGDSSGPTPVVSSRKQLADMGLSIKYGDVQKEGSTINPQLLDIAKKVQGVLGDSFAYFSAFNDRYHQENSPLSAHTKGMAFDFVLREIPTPAEGEGIVRWLKSMGASKAIDEYNNPSAKSTAGHIHAEIPKFGDGGMVLGPTLAMIGEKGPEAVVPINKMIPNLEKTMKQFEEFKEEFSSKSETSIKSLTSDLRQVLQDTVAQLSRSQNDVLVPGLQNLTNVMQDVLKSSEQSVDVQNRLLSYSM